MMRITVALKEPVLCRLAAAVAAIGVLASAPALAEVRFLSPGSGEALSPGTIVEVRWTSLCGAAREGRLDESELVLSLDGGRTFPVRVSPELRACASRFLWKVPALPADHARLALRAGAEERDETEAIEVLTSDFRILPDPDGRVEELRRRTAEMWTPFDPSALTAEDLLEQALSAARSEIGVPTALPEAAMPTPSTAPRPGGAANRTSIARVDPASRVSSSSARPAGGHTPLRL